MPLPLSEHVANTHQAYNNLVEHLVPTSAELNDWLPTLRNVAPARLEELRELGPRANWSGEMVGRFGTSSPNAAVCSSRNTWPNTSPPPISPNG